MDPELTAIVDRFGIFLRHEAKALGYHDRAIAKLCREGTWHRVRHGSYTLRETWEAADPGERHLITSRAAYRTAGTEVALSHSSALTVHGTPHWGLPLDDAHLTRLDGLAGRHAAGVRQHRGRILAGDLEYDGDLVYMSAARTALEVITMTDVERALIVVNGLLHEGRTTVRALEDRSVEMLAWPFSRRTEVVLRLCDPLIESVAETRTSYLFHRQGVPRPVPQFEVFDDGGLSLGRVDFAWPELKVFVEVDGRVKYEKYLRPGETASDAVVREKRREELICEATGWICIRLMWSDLADPARVAERVRRAIRAAAGRRTA